MGDGHHPAGALGLGCFDENLSLDRRGGLGNGHRVLVKVDVGPGESQDFPLAHAGVDGQLQQHLDLERRFPAAHIRTHPVGFPGVVDPLVTGYLPSVFLVEKGQKGVGLLRSEELDLLGGVPDGRELHGTARVAVQNLPLHGGAEHGGENHMGLVDGGGAVAALLAVLAGPVPG